MKVLKVAVLLAILLIVSSPFALAYDLEQKDPHVATKIFDLVIVRPLSIVVSTASTGFFLGTLPITFPAGVSEPAARILVEAPWRFTNARYLGEFNRYKDEQPITVVRVDKTKRAAEAARATAQDQAAKIDVLSTKMDRLWNIRWMKR